MRRFFFLVAILLLIGTLASVLFVSVSAAAMTEADVKGKIEKLKALFPDESYFTTTGKNVCATVTKKENGTAHWCSGGKSCQTCRLEYLFSDKCTNSNIKTAINQVPALKNIPKGRASCCGFATFAFATVTTEGQMEQKCKHCREVQKKTIPVLIGGDPQTGGRNS